MHTVSLDVEYGDVGSGPALVFAHGAYVTAAVWDDVVQLLSARFRCLTPTWPFGAQRYPVGAADLSVPASGRRIAGFLAALHIQNATLVANDTGGGIVLAALGDDGFGAERVSGVVLTNCDSFEHFPPKAFAHIVALCRLNTALGAQTLRGLATGLGLSTFVRSTTRQGISHAARGPVFGGFATSQAVRKEAARFSAGLPGRHTMAAVPRLRQWPTPVLCLWGQDDPMFPVDHVRRLAETFPHTSTHLIADASTYVMLDKPDETAGAITEFMHEDVRL